ncbi:hypothetical protein DXG03_001716 [Asterophora parasitica]|uniref:DNA2/NAM7 helicase-like C-terminal domain-containing protein n=1 Tax=Asterophora parasitica TaxID=117018 RepID=A0A9P7GH81_9AGAR|nr:hypothetical protein DXG03_001716 [Asterophora parasitica]
MPPQNRPMLNLMQTLVDSAEFSLIKIPVTKVNERDIDQDTFSVFDKVKPLGISPGYSSAGKLVALAISDDTNCIIVEFNVAAKPVRDNGRGRSNNRPKSPPPHRDRNLDALSQRVLCRPVGELFAFDMGPLALSLYTDSRLRIKNAVDIQSGLSATDRKPLTAIKDILGTAAKIKEQNVVTVFRDPVYELDDRKKATELAMRAWISQLLAHYGNGAETLARVHRIDTEVFSEQTLDVIAKNANDTLRQNQTKPLKTHHQATITTDASGQVIESSNFKSRLRSDKDIVYTVPQGGMGGYKARGQVGIMRGKAAPLVSDSRSGSRSMTMTTTVTSIGRDDPTTAEAHRAATILRVLQGFESLLSDSVWIQNIFFPSDEQALSWPLEWSDPPPPPPKFPSQPPSSLLLLNPSQRDAVNTMYSSLDKHRITIIQGPPGTGKTSVIASFVEFAILTGGDGIWLVAQSNVAVKNIAEKLLAIGFLDWKLLVSKDFILEWHEHIYTKVQQNIIRSDRFKFVKAHTLRGCKVMLCTLSMLSNTFITNFTCPNPIKTLIVDEASQIEIGNYMSILSTCGSLRKACFIGDDKQLPPFGQEDLQDLQSIFEVSHLRTDVLFLKTQYRMPPQIGCIISDLVYDGKLESNPLHPITEKTKACHFIDVPGTEKANDMSFINQLECDSVIKLSQILQGQQKEYQIITPYDGQRTTIENAMKETPGLDWENKVFNVDSFQGNEEDYIIISLVRSHSIGFLNNLRRTNVMLTRCKKGMFIMTSRTFLEGHGGETLVGDLLQRVGPDAWLTTEDMDAGNF